MTSTLLALSEALLPKANTADSEAAAEPCKRFLSLMQRFAKANWAPTSV